MMRVVYGLLILLALAWLVYKYTLLFRKGVQRIGDHPGFRSLISPLSMAGFGTPYIWGIYPGFNMPWMGKHKLFAKWGCDVISCVSVGGQSILYLADADLIQKINGNGNAYPKPVKEYTVLNFFGPNLVTATGADWRRQQAVSKTVFNYNGWCFLWDETHRIFEDMMQSSGWMEVPVGQDIHVKHAVDITLRVALLAIANAGFGMMMKWKDDAEKVLTSGHTMSFQTALHVVAQSSILKLALPKWAFDLPFPRLRRIRTAFMELEVYIQHMIKSKKEEILGVQESEKPERHDLFHNLVRASLTGEEPLSDAELQGNIYIYLLAGHETTAHSIAFTFALLALYPEKQEELFQHILRVMPKDGKTTYDDYAKFDYVKAVYFETLRMFPPVQQIPKILAKDTVFVFDKSNEHNEAIGRIKGTHVAHGSSSLLVEPDTSEACGSLPSSPNSVASFSSLDSLDSITSNFTNSTSATSIFCADDEDDVTEQIPGFLPPPTPASKSPPSVPLGPSILLSHSDCKPMDQGHKPLSAEDHQKTLVVEKDTVIFVNPPAVHYNPKYYPDPYEFKPERFLGNFDQKTFLPFSSGTRVCLGRHFSEVESVCWIAYMMRHFSVHPVPAFEGETVEQMKERMFNAIPLITLSPQSIPLIFRRRSSPSL